MAKKIFHSSNNEEQRVMSSTFEVSKSDDKNPAHVTGHAAVFDQLSENLGGFREKIAPGAFDGVLNDDVRALFNHDPNLILGRTAAKTLKLSVDTTGLKVDFSIPDTSYGRDLIVSLERGDINQMSFGFKVEEEEWNEDETTGAVIRTITKVKRLFDISPITFPAYPQTDVAKRSMDEWKESIKAQIHPDDDLARSHNERNRDLMILSLQ